MEEEKIIFVRRMIEGDEKAFDELYHAYSKKLYRMAYFITGNHSDSEDILQVIMDLPDSCAYSLEDGKKEKESR